MLFNLGVLTLGLAVLPLPAWAQLAVPPATPEYEPLASDQLDQLLGPIALYPDPLIAQILPASTLPSQIVLADRYVSGGGDTNQIDQQPWDPSIQALARYPNVLKYMDDNLNWTTDLGQAFLNQQQDVMDSIQRLRTTAKNLGNLQSTPQQQVVMDGSDIEILPADPEVIYVPVYQPATVFYQSGFGAPFITFGIGFPIGFWLNYDCDWYHHNIIVWNRSHPRPPNWWRNHPPQRTILDQHPRVWRPENHRNFGSAYRGDRGWGDHPAARPISPGTFHPQPVPSRGAGPHNNNSPARNNAPHAPVSPPNAPSHNNNAPNLPPHPNNAPPRINVPAQAAPPVVPRPAPAQHFAPPAARPPSSDAFIGIQSSHQTRTFSDRGQQSLHTVTPPAPRPSPPASHGGGNPGPAAHNSGSPHKR